MQELSPSEFRLGNYDAGIISTDIFLGSAERFNKWLKEQSVIGWCKHPSYRYQEWSVAVMFELGNGEYWCHVPDFVWEMYSNGK